MSPPLPSVADARRQASPQRKPPRLRGCKRARHKPEPQACARPSVCANAPIGSVSVNTSAINFAAHACSHASRVSGLFASAKSINAAKVYVALSSIAAVASCARGPFLPYTTVERNIASGHYTV